MTTSLTHESKEQFAETVPYESYRGYCDDYSTSFRQIGILGEEKFNDVLQDPNTVHVDLPDGRSAPVFASIDHIEGYDHVRTRRLTEKANTYLLTLPPNLLQEAHISLADQVEKLGGGAVLVETPSEETEGAKEFLSQEFAQGWEVKEFIDPRTEEGHETAAMSVHSGRFEMQDEQGELLPRRNISLAEAFAEELFEELNDGIPFTTWLVESSTLHKHADLMDQLWQLCDNRFEWLGDYHPVSMEETKDFFEKVLLDPHTHTIIRFVEDENGKRRPACFGFFTDGLSEASWLSEDFQQAVEQAAAEAKEDTLFFHGIMSEATNMEHYAKEVMSLATKLFYRRGGAVRLVIETTNFSRFIPGLVKKYTSAVKRVVLAGGKMQELGQQDYWYLCSTSKNTE